jgi:prevent-host-death family protein
MMVICGYKGGAALGSVGVRDLRDNLSAYLRRVRQGELLVITDRGRPIGELGPAARAHSVERARALVRKGFASWSGGKPKGLSSAPRPGRGLVSEAVIEDRR